MTQKNKLPEGWEEVELFRYLELVSSGVKRFSGTKKYIDTGSLETGKIKDFVNVTYEDRPSRANMEVREGDVLFAKMKDTEKIYLVSKEDLNHLYSTGFAVLRIKNNSKLIPQYVCFWLRTENFQTLKNRECTGATQKAIGETKLRKFIIIVPPLVLQNKIVSILGKAEKAKEWRKEADKLAPDFLKSVFLEMFGDKKKFEKVKIEETIIKTENENPEREYPNKYFEYVDISSIDNKRGKIINATKILGKEAPSRAKQKIKFNDLIISTVRPNLNSVALVPKELNEQICSTGFCVLRADLKKILPEYLYQISRSSQFIESMKKIAKGASYPAVSDRDILSYEIPLPPLPLQQKFASIVKEVESMEEQQKHSKEQIDNLFSVLMQKAFKGELVT